MAFTRFTERTGSLMDGDAVSGEIPSHLDRPVVMVYAGKFKSIDGDVEVTEEDIDRMVATHGEFLSKLKRLAGAGDVPVRSHPPLQLDHSTSAKDTVGRLIGSVEKGSYTLTDGTIVPAAMSTVRILGKENVEKYLDGRYSNVSIGADFATGKITELTITPFPAAAEATLMTAGEDKKGESMHPHQMKGLKHHLAGLARHLAKHLDEAGAKEYGESHAALAKHLEVGPETEGKTEMWGGHESLAKHLELAAKHMAHLAGKEVGKDAHEEMTHHLEGLAHHLEVGPDTEGQTKMEGSKAHMEAMKKHLASAKVADEPAEAPAAAEHAKMTAALKEGMKKLAAANQKMAAASKKVQLSGRLSRLRAMAKITPAEIKKIDLTRLAAESDATIDAVFKTYEDREPVILTGMFGDAAARDVSEVSREMRMKRLEHEVRMNMPMKAREMQNKQARMAEGENEVNIHVDALPGGEHDTEMAAIHKLMDEGKIAEAKEQLSALMGKLRGKLVAGEGHDDHQKELSGLAEEVKQMQNEMRDLTKLAGIETQ